MPVISHRGAMMPPSPIRKLVPFADAAKKRGIKVYHLNIGQPDIVTPPSILDAVRHTDMTVLEYSPSAGFDSYRKKLVEYYKRNDIDVTANQIIVTTGGSEAIMFAIMSCLDAGDEIIIPEPFYANYNGFSTSSGVKVVPIPSSIESGFALPAIEAFEKAITPQTKAIMICNPNNPTGYLYSMDELNVLKEICLKHDLFLFSDEAYREFCYDGSKHISAMSIPGLEEHAILLDTISKRYSACGGRIGAFVTRNQQVLDAAMKFAQARLSPPTFAQILGEAAVDLPADYFDEVHAEYTSRRDVLVDRLKKLDGVLCPLPGGAFYAMAQLPVENAERFCQWLLEDFSHNGATVMMAPAAGFYATPGKGRNEVRMAYVLNKEDINGAMDCLEAALKVYKN
ncbi:aspartate aminotransferase [Flavipsychrobacter stenotrophus]|uniref:Aspartate aminotransferase n=1 Tax=Flavipsychrobacter stenotrophus TaxID=2077091 RepID=A0A2S7SWF8_9BACT|nr:pyridoxal phosphate-dependent aminotransferase [Flavipsychrobacter stenotrophus]PQJ11048.1 aspartate aminotransferase [Flavipsychrobacter stenotrophus]